MRINKEFRQRSRSAIKEHGDRRIQVALETACELALCQFGVSGTIKRLQAEIDFLKEFADEPDI